MGIQVSSATLATFTGDVTIPAAVNQGDAGVDPWPTVVAPPSDGLYGRDTAPDGGGAEPPAALGSGAITSVILAAGADNTGTLYWGYDNSLITANGFPLTKGQGVGIPIDNLSKVFVLGSDAGQQYAYAAVVQ